MKHKWGRYKRRNTGKRLVGYILLLGLFVMLGDTTKVVKAEGPFSENDIQLVRTSSVEGQHNSYLFRVETGYERVVWYDNLYVEGYTNDWRLVSTKEISFNLLMPSGGVRKNVGFGGAYEGAAYNFVVMHQANPKKNASLITLKVLKFDKNWNYIDCCEMNQEMGVEIETVEDCAVQEWNGQLWLSVVRYGLGKSDNKGIQNLILDEESMQIVGSAVDSGEFEGIQFTVCNGRLYQMELSEENRAVYVKALDSHCYTSGMTTNGVAGAAAVTSVYDFWMPHKGDLYSWELGGSVSGVTASEAAGRLLTVGKSVNQNKLGRRKGNTDDLVNNVWIRSTSADLQNTTGGWLSVYPDGKNKEAGSPHIAKVENNIFLVLWSEYNIRTEKSKLKYIFVDATANPISKVYTQDGTLSDVVPVPDGNGNVVWYTSTWDMLIFYTIHSDGTYSMKKLRIQPENVNTLIEDPESQCIYRVTDSSKKHPQVEFVGCRKKKISFIEVADEWEYNTITYQVTSIAPGAMQGNPYIRIVSLGKNVKKIGNKAFYNNHRLGKVFIESKWLKDSTVGKKVFKGSKRKLVVYVTNKGKVNAYKKLFRKKGISKKARFVYSWN